MILVFVVVEKSLKNVVGNNRLKTYAFIGF